MSYKPEILLTGRGAKWVSNTLRFATKAEAEANVESLRQRWTMVSDTRASHSDDPVNFKWVHGIGLIAVEEVTA